MIQRPDTPHDSRAETIAEHYREESTQSLAHIQTMNTTATNIITEADAVSFFRTQSARIVETLKPDGPFSWVPRLFIRAEGKPFEVTAYIDPGFENVSGTGDTIDEAIDAFRIALAEKRPNPEKLRADAAKLIEEADKMEAAKAA